MLTQCSLDKPNCSYPLIAVTKMMKIKTGPVLEFCQDRDFSSHLICGAALHPLNKMDSYQIQDVARCGVPFSYNYGMVCETMIDDMSISGSCEDLSQFSSSGLELKTNMDCDKHEVVAACESSFVFNFDVESVLPGETRDKLLWLDTYDYCETNGEWALGIGEFFELRTNTVLKLKPELTNIMLKALPNVVKRDGRTAYRFGNILLELRMVNGDVHAFALGVSKSPVLFVTWEKTPKELLCSEISRWLTRKLFAFSEDILQLSHLLSDATKARLIMNRTFEALAVCYVDIPPRHVLIRAVAANITPAWIPPNWNTYTKLGGVARCHICGNVMHGKCPCSGNVLTAREIVARKRAKKDALIKFAEMGDNIVNSNFATRRLPFKKSHDVSKQIPVRFNEPDKRHSRMFDRVTHVGKRNVPSVVLANKKFEEERRELAMRDKKTTVSELIDRLVIGPKPKSVAAATPKQPVVKTRVKKVSTPPTTPIIIERGEVDKQVLQSLFGTTAWTEVEDDSDGFALDVSDLKVAQGNLLPDEYPFNTVCGEMGVSIAVVRHLEHLANEHVGWNVFVGRLERMARLRNLTLEAYLDRAFDANPTARVCVLLYKLMSLCAQGDNEVPSDTDEIEELYPLLSEENRSVNGLYRVPTACEWSHYAISNELARYNFVVSFMATYPPELLPLLKRDCRRLFRMNLADWLEYSMYVRAIDHGEEEIYAFVSRALSILDTAVMYYGYDECVAAEVERRLYAQGLADAIMGPVSRAADATTKVMTEASTHMQNLSDTVKETMMEVKRVLTSYYTPVATAIKQIDSMFKWTDFVRIGLRFNALAQTELSWSSIISFLVDTMADISNALTRALKNVELSELKVELYKMKQILECRDAAINAFINSPESMAKYQTIIDAWKIDHPDYEASMMTCQMYNRGAKVAQGVSSLFDNFLSVIAGLSNNSMKHLRNFNCVVSAWRNAKTITAEIVKMLPECVRELFGLVSDNFMLSDFEYVEFTREFAALDHKYTIQPRDILDISLAKLKKMHEASVEFFRRSTMCVNRGVNTVFLSYATKRLSTILQARTKVELLGSKRYNPIAYLLHGSPGVGKSELAKKIAAHLLDWAKDPELNADATFAMMAQPGVYSFQSQLDFFDGYHREGVMVIDELGSRTDGEDLVNLFSLVSSNTFIPPMASLEDDVIGCKATPFTSHSVIACSNCARFDHLSGAFITPQAIDRRFVAKIAVTRNPNSTSEFEKDFSHLQFTIDGVTGTYTLPQLLYILKNHPKFGFMQFFKTQMTIDHGLMDLDPVDLTTLQKKNPVGKIVVQGAGAEVALSFAGVIAATSFGMGVNILLSHPKDDFATKVMGWCTLLAGAIGMLVTSYVGAKSEVAQDPCLMEAESGKGGGKSGPAKVRTIRGRGFRGTVSRQGCSERYVDFDGVEELDTTDPKLRQNLAQGVRDLVAMSLEDKVARCLCRIELWEGSHRIIGMNAIPLGHLHFLAPFHFLELDSPTTTIHIKWLAADKEFKMASKSVVVTRFAEDAAVYTFPGLTWRAPSMLKNFVRDSELVYVKRCPISLVTKNRGENVVGIYSTIGEKMTEVDEYSGAVGQKYKLLKGFHYEMNTTFGDCGGPIICHDKDVPHKIMGFHVAGMVDVAYGMATLVTYEMLVEVVGPDLMKNVDVAPLKAMGAIDLVGVHTPVLASNRRTNFYRTTVDCFPVPKEPTDLRIKDGVDPVLNAMMKNSLDRSSLSKVPDDIQTAVAQHLLADMSVYDVERRVRTFDEALVAIGSLDRVNLKSSPGYPYVLGKRKTDFVEIGEDGLVNIKDPALRVDTARIITEAKTHEPNIMWVSCGKDECLVPGKQCRIFEIPPFSFTLALRQYFGDFVSFIHSHPMDFKSIVGINPESHQWHQMALRLRTVSQIGLAVDWKKFDSTLIVCAFKLLAFLANAWYNDGAINATIRRNLIAAAQNRLTVFEEFVMFIRTGNPSGWMLTTIVNTFGQYLLFADFWLQNAPLHLRDLTIMDKYVVMFLYGDDGIISVHADVREWFNYEKLAVYFVKYGMIITSDAKDSSASFMPIEDLTILKRGFRLDPRSFWVPTMAWKTMFNMMNYQRRTKHATREETMRVVFENFQVFLYFHGKEIFNDTVRQLGMLARTFNYYNSLFYGVGNFAVSIPE